MTVNEQAISAQLGRGLRARSEVVSSCHLGLPVVIEVPPVLDDGTPFPTRYWLSCPLAVRRIGRLESQGEIRRIEELVEADPQFFASLSAAHDRYRTERDALIPDDAEHRPSGGVAGAEAGVKCLHAHYADEVAGRASAGNGFGGWDNQIGEIVAGKIEPLDCTVPCVIGTGRNPEWREPRRGVVR
jgi:hypothetical protein